MFYKIIDTISKVDHLIKWNCDCISGGRSGFIIQHMKIDSHLNCVKSDDYWEAWKISNGENVFGTQEYDDNWSPIPDWLISNYKEDIEESVDGEILYSAEVFFIPISSPIYKDVDMWIPNYGSPANELPMTYIFDAEVKEFYVCSREFKWNYKEIYRSMINWGKKT